MAFKIGLHTAPTDYATMLKVWQRADAAGFHWISVSDHLYTNPPAGIVHEGVSIMTALAATTKNVQVGNYMFCLPFRNPALLAQAAVTIDHVSNGRCQLGIGAGWLKEEFDDFGWDFGTLGERMDRREEGLRIIHDLLREGQSDFKGKYYTMDHAKLYLRPVNPKLPIWLGGSGPKRTPALAAKYADGFNAPFLSPEDFQGRMAVLDQACEKEKRDPKTIQRSLNLLFKMGADAKSAKAAKASVQGTPREGGSLAGTAQEVTERIGQYRDAGADFINIALSPPYDLEAFEAFIAEVLPVFH